MKRLSLFVVFLLAMCLGASAQNYNFNIGGLQFSSGPAVPGSCPTEGAYFFKNTATTGWSTCQGGVYVSGGGGSVVNGQTEFDVGTNGVASGILGFNGLTSGKATITAPAVAGTAANPLIFTNAIQLPAGTSAAATLSFNTLNAGGTIGPGLVNTAAGSIGFHPGNGSGTVALTLNMYRWNAGTAVQTSQIINTAAGTGATIWQVSENSATTQTITIAGIGGTGTGPAIALGGNGGNATRDFAATSGTSTAVAIGNATVGRILFNPASGNATFTSLLVNPTINQTGTASGAYTALKVNVVETALLGAGNLLLDLQAGTTGGTSKFSVDNSGNMTAAGNLLPAVGSAATPALTFTGNANKPGFYNLNTGTTGVGLAGGGNAYEVWNFAINGAMNVVSGGGLTWTSSATDATSGADTGLTRAGAGIAALGTGAAGSTAGTLRLTSMTLLNPTVVGSLPAAAGAVGQFLRVSDSTAVSAEGQTCVGGSSNVALAWSNGSVWKCF